MVSPVFFYLRRDSKNLIATVRWTVARDGLTERNHNFCIAKMRTNLQRVTKERKYELFIL